MSMYIPLKGSQRERIAQLIIEHGPLSTPEIYALFPSDRATKTFESISYMVFRAALLEVGGKLQISAGLRSYYEDMEPVEKPFIGEVAGPRYYGGFKPWTGKHSPVNALRREPIREGFSVKSASIGYPVKEYA